MFAQVLKQVEAVHARHVHVADHEVKLLGSHELEGVEAIHRGFGLIAGQRQSVGEHVAHAWFIIDNENSSCVCYGHDTSLFSRLEAENAQKIAFGFSQINHKTFVVQ